jgi:hypothetical protein
MAEAKRIYDDEKRKALNCDWTLALHAWAVLWYPLTMAVRTADFKWIVFASSCYVACGSFGIGYFRSRYMQQAAEVMAGLRPQFEEKHGFAMDDFLPVSAATRQRPFDNPATDVGYLDVSDGFHIFGDLETLHLTWRQIDEVKVMGSLRPRLRLTYRLKPEREPCSVTIEIRDGSSAALQYAMLQQIRTRIALMPDTGCLVATAYSQAGGVQVTSLP